jgi:RNA polymerase sigma-70 factor (ECF subfamily)
MFLNGFEKKSDEALMLLIRKGEERALTELYGRYSKLMIRYFFRMLWNDDEKAQDFLHDLFLKLIERPELFDDTKRFSTWIYSVAHNMCKNEYRKQQFRNLANKEILQQEFIESTIHEEMDGKQFRKLVDRAVAEWEEDDRSLFVFRHELDMTFVQISEVLSISEGTVKSRWFYLRKALAARLQEFQTILK